MDYPLESRLGLWKQYLVKVADATAKRLMRGHGRWRCVCWRWVAHPRTAMALVAT
ncbi:MAG: hypothetical protein K9J77_06375 [Rhodoferax sp.]|nr:hypothetical protein [Rhodoferax sp.]